MRAAFSLACIAILGAQAINVTQTKQTTDNNTDPTTPEPAEGDEPMMMTTYIGFEFEGADLAEKFSALTTE
jgi:hypothetical protein